MLEKILCIKIKVREHSDDGNIIIVAYKHQYSKKVIGYIRAISVDEYKSQFIIERYEVKANYRRRGIGQELFNMMIKELKKDNAKTLIVYPNVELCENEIPISIFELYCIYKKLGFKFEPQQSVDLSIANNKMYLYILDA